MTMLPLIFTFLLAGLVCVLMLSLSRLFGPRRTTAVKSEPFECGMDQIAPPRRQLSIKFSVVAMLFIVFDVEVAFLYPWAVDVPAARRGRLPCGAGVPWPAHRGLRVCLAARCAGVELTIAWARF